MAYKIELDPKDPDDQNRARAVLGCKGGCYHWGGSSLGCEFYTPKQIVDTVNKGLQQNRKKVRCPDSIPFLETSRTDALDIINQ